MTEEQYETAYLHIKQEVMFTWGLIEEDMCDESTEDEVNRETDKQFFDKFGQHYVDIS